MTPGTIRFDLFGSEDEAQSYQFFHERTRVELSSFYDAPFWNTLILQASHSEPAIKHVLVAIGALHACLQGASFGEDGQPLTTVVQARRLFSMQQYNKSIHLLTKAQALQPAKTEVILLTCLLFICFENMQSNYLGALKHLHSGFNILKKWRDTHPSMPLSSTQSDSSAIINEQLMPIFQRLNVHDSTLDKAVSCNAHVKASSEKEAVGLEPLAPRIPDSFHTLHEARTCHDELIIWSAHAMEALLLDEAACENVRASLVAKVDRLLHRWLQCFDTYLSTDILRGNRSYHCAANFLRIRHRLTCLLLLTVLSTDETELDGFTDDFADILQMCRTYIQDDEPSVLSNVTFGFDLCIIPPLYVTATECRDPTVRREAIAVLRSCRRREGVWNSWVTANIA